MRAKRRLVVLFFCFVNALTAQNFTTRSFSNEEGLPDIYVYSVLQDKEGFLWIASGKGLVKFDGQVFTQYDLHANTQDDIIYSGVLDRQNNLWFGSFSGKVYKFDRSKNRLKLYPKSIPGSVNKIIASATTDRLYFLSKGNGIYYLEKNKIESIEISQEYQVNAVEELDNERLLMATDEGLFIVQTNSDTLVRIGPDDWKVNQIQALKQKRNSFLISVSGKEIVEIHVDEKGASILRTVPVTQNVSGDLTQFCFNEQNEDVYFGTSTERFACFNLSTGKHKLVDENEFQGNINSLFIDKECNIWASTTGKGLYRFFRNEFDVIWLNKGSVFAITQDSSGNTYFGTGEGLVRIPANGGASEHILRAGTKPLGKVNALYCDAQNKLWIGTDENGLVLAELPGFKACPISFSDIGNISVNAINGNRETGEVQVCTNLEGVYNYENYKLLNHFSVQNSLLHNNVHYSLKTKSGRIYYATHNTSFNFSKGNQIYEMDIKDRGLISDFNSFAESADGSLVIGTNGEGIYFLRDTSISPFALNEKLEAGFCKGLVYDNDQNLWMMMGKHLYKYYTKLGVLARQELNINKNASFNKNTFYKNENGDLFFGTTNYVIYYNAANARIRSNELPDSYFARLLINDSIVDFSKPLRLKHGNHHFLAEYSALSLKNSEGVHFKYMLEGRDASWSELTKIRRMEFANLPDGAYTLKIKAYNSDGFEESQPAVLSFVIEPPFWKRSIFWLLAALLLTALVVVIIRMRTASLIKAKQRLEGIVRVKTSELRREKELVESNNKIIEEQNQEIKDSITYAKRIQDALLPSVHSDMAQYPELFVFYQPRDIVSGDFYWLGEVDGIKIIVAADCTGHGVPGALMSMIGSTLLNKIVLERKITEASAILKELDLEVKKALKQHSADATKDGMDLALCRIDTRSKKVSYAAALRPLFHVSKNGLREYTPTKLPIGGYNYGEQKQFTETELEVQENDVLYIFSDGYADQFGGEKGKKFMLRNFKQLLVSIAPLSLHEQQQKLEQVYNQWKGTLDQVDDVLVIGIKV